MKQTKQCKECKKEFDSFDEYDDTCYECGKEQSCNICLDCSEWFIAKSFQILCNKCKEKNHKQVEELWNKQ